MKKKYEAMFIVKPDLKEDERTAVFKAIKDQVLKNDGRILEDQIWAEKRRLAYDLFPIGGQTRFRDGLYYLVSLEMEPSAIATLRSHYDLNETVLRYAIFKMGEKVKKEKKTA